MAETDISGYLDSDPACTEIPVDSLEHVYQTIYHALSTPRGYDREDAEAQGWWADLVTAVQGRATGALQGMANSVANTLLDVDPRIATLTITVGGVVNGVATYTVDGLTAAGEILSTVLPAPLPPLPEDDTPLPGPPAETAPQIADLATSPAVHPTWLIGRYAGRLAWVVGTVLDGAAQRLRDGMYQKFPDYCEAEAIPFHCRQYGIGRGVRESEESIRARLKLWLPSWRRAGSPFAILEQLQSFFLPQVPTVRIVEHRPVGLIGGRPSRAIWSSRAPDGTESTHVETPSNFDLDSTHPTRPARLEGRDLRFTLIVEQPDGDPDNIMVARPGAPAVTQNVSLPLGVEAAARFALDLQNIGVAWKASGSWCVGLIVNFSPALFNPTGSGAGYPDGTWWRHVNDAGTGRRIPEHLRLMAWRRFPGGYLELNPG